MPCQHPRPVADLPLNPCSPLHNYMRLPISLNPTRPRTLTSYPGLPEPGKSLPPLHSWEQASRSDSRGWVQGPGTTRSAPVLLHFSVEKLAQVVYHTPSQFLHVCGPFAGGSESVQIRAGSSLPWQFVAFRNRRYTINCSGGAP